jgi:hypothetical protein
MNQATSYRIEIALFSFQFLWKVVASSRSGATRQAKAYKPQRGGAKMAALTEIAMKIRERGVSGTVRAAVNRARAHVNDPYRFLRRTKGVVHVGANEGQERDIYARYNLNVLWIEPLPDVSEYSKRI